MDPLDDNDDSLLRAHFEALRTDTLSRLRPAGALAARRSRVATRRRRALVGAFASALVVLGTVGGFLVAGRSGPQRNVTTAQNSTASPAGGQANQGTDATRIGDGPDPAPSSTALPGPPGGPVPPGFRAESVTFIGSGTAWALGYAPCLAARPWSQCPAVLRSRDGGHTWVGVPAPGNAAYLGDIRFVNALDGWVVVHSPLVTKDPGGASGVLYATHDGGATWHQVASVPGAAEVEAAAGRVWVTAGTPAGAAPAASASATPSGAATGSAPTAAVYSAASGSDTFVKVADVDGTGLVVQGHYAYVFGGDELVSVRDTTVVRRSLPCPSGFTAPPVMAASAEQSLAVVCAFPPGTDGTQAKLAFTSTNGGATWAGTAAGLNPSGYVTSLAATGSTLYLAGQRMPVRVSRDRGDSWGTALDAPSSAGFGYVGFTDGSRGVALVYGGASTVYLTSDAGRTWTPYRFG